MKLLLLIVPALLWCHCLSAQEDAIPLKGSWNFGVLTGGGSSISDPSRHRQLLLVGGRFGKALSKERGKGRFRGQLEYAIETIPAFLVFQTSTVYGFDVTPLLFRWNFTSAKKVAPFFELGAGVLFTTKDVPEQTFPINFTPQAAFGFHVFTNSKNAMTLALRYMHISNAGLDLPNPGINSLQLIIGYQWSR